MMMRKSSEITAFDVDLLRFHMHARVAAIAFSMAAEAVSFGELYCVGFSSILPAVYNSQILVTLTNLLIIPR